MIPVAVKAVVSAILFQVVLIHPISAQDEMGHDHRIPYFSLVENSFGPDQNLINGVQYFDRYAGVEGVPYFINIGFMDGEITIKGKVYKDIKIRYDMYSQNVELAHDYFYGGQSWLVAVADHIEAFRIGEFRFIKADLEETGKKFYQVIETGLFTCYIHWAKRLQPVQNDHFFTHRFSNSKATFLLEKDGGIKEINSRKVFVNQFSQVHRKAIKHLLKRNQFNLRLATPDVLVYHMNAVANLLNTGGIP